MVLNEAAVKERLINENPQFAKLAAEHRRYDEELQKLIKQPYLTPEDQMQETRLKKMKLRLKDQMTMIMHEFMRQR